MNLKFQDMFVDVQLGDGVILAELIDEKGTSVLVKCLEENVNSGGRYSFRNAVWISKEHIINSYSAIKDMDSLGYEEVGDNLYIQNDVSDVDYEPNDDDDDDDDDDISLCSDDSLN